MRSRLFARLSRWLSRQSPRRARRGRTRLGYEVLEDRAVPTGVVSGSVFYDYNADVYHNRGNHQFRAGVDFRQQTRSNHAGNSDGTYGFGNTYFRQYDDSGPNGNYNAGTLGLSCRKILLRLRA